MTIRARLLLLVLWAALLPALAVGLLFADQRAGELSEARRALAQFAGRLADDLEDRIRATVQLLHAIARADELAGDPAACGALLVDLVAAYPQYTGLIVIDDDGTRRCGNLAGDSVNLGDQTFFRALTRGGLAVHVEPSLGRITGLPVLRIAIPVRAGEAVRRVVVATLDLGQFAAALARNPPFPDTTVVLADRDGRLLVRAPRPGAAGQVADAALVGAVRAAGAPVVHTAPDTDGRPTEWAAWHQPGIAGGNLLILAGVAQDALVAPADRRLLTALAVVAAIAAVGFGGAWLLGEFGIRRQLGRIAAVAARLGSGDLAARFAGRVPAGELGALMTALNRTAGSLEAQHREIAEHNRNLAARLEVTPAPSICIDADGNVTLWNPAAARLFGIEAGDMIGRRLTVVPEDRAGQLRAILERVMGGRNAEPEPSVWNRADGRAVDITIRAAPLRSREGRVVEAILVIDDLTEKLALERQLRQAQKMEAIGQLTGGMAHDFNNLLTVIIGSAEAIEQRLSGDPLGRGLAQSILSAAERGAELNRSLLAFARQQALTPETVDVNRLLARVETFLRRTLGEQVELRVVRGDGLWPTLVDAARLEAALLNLAVNARDAMPRGGRLTIETENCVLDEDYARRVPDVQPGEYVRISVDDTGIGMSQEVQARAFEPFFTTKEFGKGSGLGLSMVYGFVKQSGGHVAIYSEPGRGTVVRLYLPRAASAVRSEPLAPPRQEAGGGEIVLVVEDDAQVREFAAAALAGLGYRVRGAASGPEALAILSGGDPVDLLFTDVIMPGGMTGLQLAEEARRLRPGLPVLYTSGYTEQVFSGGDAQRHGALLGKPYRRAELAAHVRKALAGG